MTAAFIYTHLSMPSQSQPLAGRRILVTRASHQAGKLAAGLRALGAEPVEVPLLEIQPPASFDPLDRALRNLAAYDWLLFTSVNTVRAVAARARELGIKLSEYRWPTEEAERPAPGDALKGHGFSRADQDPIEPSRLQPLRDGFRTTFASAGNPSAAHPGPRQTRRTEAFQIAAVGAATAEALANEGLTVSLVPERYVAEGLIEALSAQTQLSGRRILLARAEIARDVIPDALRAAGAQVDVVDAYRNAIPSNAAELLRAALTQPVAAALFTSSSTAEHLAEAARQARIPFPLQGVLAISIGPITSQTLRDLGWSPAGEADPHDIPGLLDALVGLLSR